MVADAAAAAAAAEQTARFFAPAAPPCPRLLPSLLRGAALLQPSRECEASNEGLAARCSKEPPQAFFKNAWFASLWEARFEGPMNRPSVATFLTRP